MSAATEAAPDRMHPARPYYQLYLLSGQAPKQADRGEQQLKLKAARARTCASLLEMLYIPLGRSGSPDECYLLYEDRNGFEAAAAFAPWLDVSPVGATVSAVGPEAAFRAGVGLFLRIVAQGALVDHRLVEACEHHLAAALQSSQLAGSRRWAAGILLGRLVSEYRYDYANARSYYRQAERIATPGSLEQMTARWWQADSFIQEGEVLKARSVCEAIVAGHGDRWPLSQVVRRAEALLKEHRKR